MKLYIEEQVREAHQNGRNGGHNETWYETDDYIKSLTPIELPTDEEIETEASDFGKKYRATTYEISAHVIGAKWMREQLKNKI